MKIAILGAGAFGTALGGILTQKKYDVDYYDTYIKHKRLADTILDAQYIILCVPSKAASYILPHLPTDKPLIVATKGILSDKIFNKFKDYMILSGPGFAADIKATKPTKLTATDARIVELFSTTYMSFDTTDDKRGVLMCGALKNVYAILAGIENLTPGTEAHEIFLQNTTAEMKILLSANNANPSTVDLSCGIGDLRLTCDIPSRNYQFGQILHKNPNAQPENTVEGISTLKRIERGEIIVPQDASILREILKKVKLNKRKNHAEKR